MKYFNNLFTSTLYMTIWVVIALGYARGWLPVWDVFHQNTTPYKQGFNVGVSVTVAIFWIANTVRLYVDQFVLKKIEN